MPAVSIRCPARRAMPTTLLRILLLQILVLYILLLQPLAVAAIPDTLNSD
jgi:hypothetical protein